MIGAQRGTRPAALESVSGALVGGQAPRGRGGVVHRPAHQRMPEAKRAAVARGPHEVGGHEPVEQDERVAGEQAAAFGG